MPNNRDSSYFNNSMQTASTELFMVAPMFITGAAMNFLKSFKLNGESIPVKSLRLLKPLSEKEAKELADNYTKTSKILNTIDKGALVMQVSAGVLYSLRAYNLKHNAGNEEVAKQDIIYSWITSAVSLVPPITSLLSNVTKRVLLSCVSSNRDSIDSSKTRDMEVHVVNTLTPVEISSATTVATLVKGQDAIITKL